MNVTVYRINLHKFISSKILLKFMTCFSDKDTTDRLPVNIVTKCLNKGTGIFKTSYCERLLGNSIDEGLIQS